VRSELVQHLARLQGGDHACLIGTESVRLAAVAAFVAGGLARGELCAVLDRDAAGPRARAALAAAGVDVTGECARGTLRLTGDRASADSALAAVREAIDAGTAAPFTGLRLATSLGAAANEVEPEALIAYEARLGALVASSGAVGLCHYDPAGVTPAALHAVLRTHPLALVGSRVRPNPFHEPAGLATGDPAARVAWMLDQLALGAGGAAGRLADLQAINRLSMSIAAGADPDEVHARALDALGEFLGSDRAAILLSDAAGVMRFVAWRNLSEGYRRLAEGHSPWPPDARDPVAVLVEDVETEPALATLRPVIRAEGIRALAFVPLRHRGRLLGKFMVYYDAPHRFDPAEVRFSEMIASQIGVAAARRRAEQERERLVADLGGERERLRSALDHMTRLHREVQEANRAKDEFLATVSHELRTPLTPMLTWVRLLRTARLDQATGARALEAIERNARVQAQLVEDLLDVSRIVTGKLRLEARAVELEGIAEAALDAVRPAADAKGIVLQAALRPGALVTGDPDRLQQVLWNLVSNAVKFTPRGGRVEVSIGRAGDHAVVTVRDTGVGIRPEFLPLVFDRFRQADASTTRVHGGLGLGLSIVRHLVELHGGTVEAASEGEGRGATFVVRLPLAPTGAKVGAEVGRPAPPATLDGVRVLVVDDEPDTLEALGTALAGYGALVRTALSTREALDALDRGAVDVLVADIAMPGEDGYALLRELRGRPPDRGGRTPAAALTAYARPVDAERAMAAGFQVHLAKPVEPSDLAAVVARLSGGGVRPPAGTDRGPSGLLGTDEA
jgi:signal transduction histidine kinase/ActR/RegA family two-component response regulator